MRTVKIVVDGDFETPISETQLRYSTTDPKVSIQGSSIEIPYRESVELEFELHATEGGQPMRWAQDPFTWPTGKAPRNRSKWTVTRLSDTSFRLKDPMEQNGHFGCFLVLVDQTGREHSSPDPTVVNKGAPGGGPSDERDELEVWWRQLRRRDPGAAREVLGLARKLFAKRYR